MKKKVILILLVIVLLISIISIVFAGYGSEEPRTLRLASMYPEKSTLVYSLVKFAEEIEQRTEGRITFDKYFGGSIMQAEENLDAIGSGAVDIGSGIFLYSPGKTPLGTYLFNFIFNEPNYHSQVKIMREMYEKIPALNDELAQYNIAPVLLFYPLSTYMILSSSPIENLSDLKGKKIAHTAIEYTEVFKTLGAVSVISPIPQWYEQLQRGVVDMVCGAVEHMEMYSLFEVAKYIYKINLNTPLATTMWMNMDTLKSLDPEDQKLFYEVAKDVEKQCLDHVDDYMGTAYNKLVENGVIFVEMSDEDLNSIINDIPDIPAIWAQKMENRGLPGWEIVDMYIELSEREGWEFPRKWGVR